MRYVHVAARPADLAAVHSVYPNVAAGAIRRKLSRTRRPVQSDGTRVGRAYHPYSDGTMLGPYWGR